jgi:hypothetical protein
MEMMVLTFPAPSRRESTPSCFYMRVGRGPKGSRPFLLPYAPMLVAEIYFSDTVPSD